MPYIASCQGGQIQQPLITTLINQYLSAGGQDSADSAKSIAEFVQETLECLKRREFQARPDRLVLVDLAYEIQTTANPPMVSGAFNRVSLDDCDDIHDVHDEVERVLRDEARLRGFNLTSSRDLLVALIERVRREKWETVPQLIGMVTYLGQHGLVPVGFSHNEGGHIFHMAQITNY